MKEHQLQHLHHDQPGRKALRSRITLLWGILALAVWTIVCFYRPNPKVGDFHWGPCDSSPVAACGSITVPKDYFNKDAGVATIALARYKATKCPRKGTVFLNPGGPGGSGVEFLIAAAGSLAKIIGDDWDLIGFDPRGIGKTLPAVRCFPDPIEERLFFANTVLEHGITVPSVANITSENMRHELVLQYRQFLAMVQAQGQLCAKNMGEELRYMGTATVVRDIDFMSKVFDGKDSPLNFWGASYGSAIGAYLVNMFPNRVGHVLIDGILDPVMWSSEPSYYWATNVLTSMEKTYEMFLKDCAQAGPKTCPLAESLNEPWQNIERRLEAFFDELAISPLPIPFASRPGFLTSGAARGLMLINLASPRSWPQGAIDFAQAMNGNGTALFNALVPDYRASNAGANDLSRLAVSCLDNVRDDYPTAEEPADVGLKMLHEGSIHFGLSLGVSEPDGGCQYWPVHGAERFAGPWNATLRTPMLIISNTHDPITPISSGVRVNSLMPNSSILVIQDGPGHCSLAMPSLCTVKLALEYFADEMPTNGTICPVEAPTFPAEEDLKMFSASDRDLLQAAQEVGKYVGRRL
ncbi:Alpha/Beta hydrolase protein [Mycena floridula]|nr:Alpha/Beta hydrolase protein [Mycena floridula]